MADDFYEKNVRWQAQRDQFRQTKSDQAKGNDLQRKQ
jgi:hypothetical protein